MRILRFIAAAIIGAWVAGMTMMSSTMLWDGEDPLSSVILEPWAWGLAVLVCIALTLVAGAGAMWLSRRFAACRSVPAWMLMGGIAGFLIGAFGPNLVSALPEGWHYYPEVREILSSLLAGMVAALAFRAIVSLPPMTKRRPNNSGLPY